MIKWQPIESAPKDKDILLYRKDEKSKHGIAQWDEEDGCWYVYDREEEKLMMFDATFWAEL